MRHIATLIVCWMPLVFVPIASAQDIPKEPIAAATEAPPPEGFAEGLFALSEVLLARHVDPPARQQMYLAAAKALLRATEVPVTAELSRRVSGLSTKEEFLRLTEEIWGTAFQSQKESSGEFTMVMEAGLLSVVPDAHLISRDNLRIQSQLQSNRYVGVGIVLSYDEKLKLPKIMDRFVRGPAHRAGIQRGDLIVEVDGTDTHGMALQDVVQLLRGEEGTRVTMAVRQPEATKTRRCEITRGVVPRETVVGYERLPDDDWNFRPDSDSPIGYVRIREITSSTLHELRIIERRLESQGIGALVLDFRGNPGGRLHDHVTLAGGLLDGGIIGRVRIAEKIDVYEADRDCLFRDWPIMVLIDRTIAGGTEALVAALQDHRRATMVGEPTSGRGYVRSAIATAGGKRSVILPIGVLERADGTPLVGPSRPSASGANGASRLFRQHAGRWRVEPDHLVARSDRDRSEQEQSSARDAQLAKALELLRAELARTDAS